MSAAIQPVPASAPAALVEHIGIKATGEQSGKPYWAFTEEQLIQYAGVINASARDHWYAAFVTPMGEILKCWPSHFADGNEHMLKAARAAMERPEFCDAHPGEAVPDLDPADWNSGEALAGWLHRCGLPQAAVIVRAQMQIRGMRIMELKDTRQPVLSDVKIVLDWLKLDGGCVILREKAEVPTTMYGWDVHRCATALMALVDIGVAGYELAPDGAYHAWLVGGEG